MTNGQKPQITYLTKHPVGQYSDGDEVEDYLLELFQNGLSDTERRKILSSTPGWPITYHLAYERLNLLGWYQFDHGSRILEVGAGCGSITESLVSNQHVSVVSNDLSERRSLINASRNKTASNLEVVIGNLYDYKPKQLFDYIVCVGVYEYAGTFINTMNPYHDFMVKLKSFLKPGGTILIAIENQMGHKYFSGAREDHTGGYYDGLNDYPAKKKVRTFGKREITKRLELAGFTDLFFYYPFPDYKLPTIIYSDHYYPGPNSVHFPRGVLPTPNPDQPRQFVFSEANFISVLERNDLFREFSNSFLIEAKADV